jgi:DNA-binding response OmpR family regulator
MEVEPMSILLVEDEAMLRHGLVRSLAARGHMVVEAEGCRQAMEEIAGRRPDLLLLDINLPDGTGWDILRELRDRGSAIPAIVLSAVPPSAARVREFRPLGVLHKPFPIDALLRMVAVAAEQRRRDRAAK